MRSGPGLVSAVICATVACVQPAAVPLRADGAPVVKPAAAAFPPAPGSASASASPIGFAEAVPAAASAPAVPEHQRPLPDELRARFRAIAADPAPRALAGDRHWLVSDERKPWIFHPHVVDKGGALIGVGADQIWLYAGWSRPVLAICLDFDRWVVDLHDIMAMMLTRSSNAAELASWWTSARAPEVEAWIAANSETTELRSGRQRAFREAREKIRVRLRHFADAGAWAGRDTFMSDPSQFDHLASLARSGRLLSLRADMAAGSAMQSVGEFVGAAGIPVRVLYLSNVEYYVPYGAGSFRKNLLALPFDDRSVVLHTVPHHGTMAGTQYYYAIERGRSFQDWIGSGRVSSFREHFKRAVRMTDQPDAEAFQMPEGTP